MDFSGISWGPPRGFNVSPRAGQTPNGVALAATARINIFPDESFAGGCQRHTLRDMNATIKVETQVLVEVIH